MPQIFLLPLGYLGQTLFVFNKLVIIASLVQRLTTYKLPSHADYAGIDGFHSIFHHRNRRAKVSCDVDIALQLPSEKMLWNPSIGAHSLPQCYT